jgi:hypothetical protein
VTALHTSCKTYVKIAIRWFLSFIRTYSSLYSSGSIVKSDQAKEDEVGGACSGRGKGDKYVDPPSRVKLCAKYRLHICYRLCVP